MSTPFYIRTASPAPIMQGLGDIMEARKQNELQQQAQKEEEAKSQKLQAILSRIQSGDQNAAIELAALDPKASKEIRSVVADYDDQKKTEINNWISGLVASGYSDEYLSTDAPFEVDDKIRALEPEQRELAARMFSAHSMNKDVYDSIFGSKEYQQGTGEMSGYAFDKTTGTFSIDPNLKKELDAKASQKAAEGKAIDFKGRQSINKDITAMVKDARQIYRAAKDLSKLRETSTAVDQLAAVFKFMKSLDPTSVVREGEQQQARSTGGPADYLIGYVNQLRGEGKLPPAVFSEMVDTAANLAALQIDATNQEVNDYLRSFGDTLPKKFKEHLRNRVPKMQGRTKVVAAPDSALEYLRANPQTAEQYKVKYGYLPVGF